MDSLPIFVELEKVEKAVVFFGSKKGVYKNGKRIRPSLAAVNHEFRFIKNEKHFKKFQEYESNGTLKANHRNNLELVFVQFDKEARKHIKNGNILHYTVLHFLIRDIIKQHNLDIENFVGSDDWVNGWKRRFGQSLRKITKFVSQVRHKTRKQIEKDAKGFVAAANQVIPLYHSSNVYNADQSGFQLDMHTARTLIFTGFKHVHCVVQTVAGITHFYTVPPLISASGKLHPKLFVILKEKGGQFPAKGHFAAGNLVVTCGTRHIMTKRLTIS
uniref:HTH CENPB-type domain-containing protein n=1 Tax=Caenorhabditis japonica TaxID=281687 RepID=A0A8R1HQC5_CAEJA